MSIDHNKALVRRYWEEVWNQGKLDLIPELLHPNYILREPSAEADVVGHEAVRHFIQTYRQAFPDLHFAIADMLAEADRVATRWLVTGTQQGPLKGLEPRGQAIAVTGISIIRIADDKLAEDWANWDTFAMLMQLQDPNA